MPATVSDVRCKARAPYDEIVPYSMKGGFEIFLVGSRPIAFKSTKNLFY